MTPRRIRQILPSAPRLDWDHIGRSPTNVVLLDRLPMPPLSSRGLTRFAEFERGDLYGITYLDTFFLKRSQSKNEAMHFHELIHVIQWRLLGPERFLYSYANGLEHY